MKSKENHKKQPSTVSKSKITKPGQQKLEAKSVAQKAVTAFVNEKGGDISKILLDPKILANIKKHSPLVTRVKIAAVNKELRDEMQEELYDNHAQTLTYTTVASKAKKTDGKEAEGMYEEVRRAVNLAYQMLTDYLKGHELAPDKYGISADRWRDFLNKLSAYKDSVGKTMHPSTSSGYIIEDITTHILTKWQDAEIEKGDYNFQDTEVMGGKSRPDITSSTAHNQKVLMDITSDASKGHILKKKGNWLQFPHVAELLYPAINFSDPSAISVKMSDAERAEVLKRAIRETIESESYKFGDFINKRESYYKEIQSQIDKLLGGRHKPSKRKLATFLETYPHIKVMIQDGNYVVEVDSYTKYIGQFDFDPYENMPKSPSHYSVDIELEDDLIEEAKTTQYTSFNQYQSFLEKKFKS